MKTEITVYSGGAPYVVSVNKLSTTAGVPRFDISLKDRRLVASVITDNRAAVADDGGVVLQKTVSVIVLNRDLVAYSVSVPADTAVPLALALLMAEPNPYAETLIQAIELATARAEEAEAARRG